MDPFILILSSFGAGIFGGLCSGFGLRWVTGRRCYRLEIGLADLQRHVASLKGADYSAARWKKRDQEIAELTALKNSEPRSTVKFDNDFMSGRP